MEGGSKIGSIDVLVRRRLDLFFRKGCAGVANAGDDEGTGSESIITHSHVSQQLWIIGFYAVGTL